MKTFFLVVTLWLVSSSAQAGVIVQVEARGRVYDNYAIFEPFMGLPVGSPAALSFRLDASDFIDGVPGGGRGYAIDKSSFGLTIAGATAEILNSLPADQKVYFVIQNDVDGGDGFALVLDAPRQSGVPLEMPSGYDVQCCEFGLGLPGTTLSSVNVLDALGGYGGSMSTLSHWVVDDFGFEPVSMRFQSLRITVAQGGWNDEGSALAGAAGPAQLGGTGDLSAGNPIALHLTGAAPNAPTLLYLSPMTLPTPFVGGTFLPGPSIRVVAATTDAAGAITLGGPMPSLPSHSEVWAQWAILDAGAPQGIALSNALRGVTE